MGDTHLQHSMLQGYSPNTFIVSILKVSCKVMCLLRGRIPVLFVLKQIITSLRAESTFPTLHLVPTVSQLSFQKESKAFSKII